MTQGEQRALVKRAARNCRAQYRKADTSGERVERELDRLIKRKTLIQANSLPTLERNYYQYKQYVQSLENALRDFYSVVAGT